ncbi:MAG: hypothetical protein COV47_01455 [Candidatus Diapherotrites archaeon CG11_big_fil_rev_8_21_14_0_20_37_9]|nr:MAG: hypothetical protein COV47_01455 [Candidatus Diapherotrites archaeon CG11_big_fil_rev_8_21_14_0_20_37_9]
MGSERTLNNRHIINTPQQINSQTTLLIGDILAKFKIIYDRNNCVAAGPCAAVDSEHFAINADDGKADLIGGKEVSPGIWELEIESDELANQAVEVCPAAVISIKKIE